jgi:hypothetical protein
MRFSKWLFLWILVLTVGCTTGGTAASPTAAVPSPEIPSPTMAVLPAEIPSPTASVQPAEAPSPTPGMVVRIDDFEGAQTAWTVCVDPECTDSSAVSVALTAEHASQGKQALQLNFEMNDRPKAVFYVQRPMDLSAGRVVRFDLFNPGTVDGVGFALTTGPDSIWYESDRYIAAEGKITTLEFDLDAGNYKTAATNWEFRSSLADRNAVVRLSIVIYPKASGAAYLDNLYLATTF